MNEINLTYWLKKFFRSPLEHPFFWIVLVILVAYSVTLSYDIVRLDDDVLVVEQYPFNKNLANIPQAFQEDVFQNPIGQGAFYRPIERLTFMLDAQFGQGAIIFMSHVSNVLYHIISICLLFILLLKLKIKKEIAFWFSLIFAVHPLTAQTVAFIAGRNDSLLAIFVFPAFIFLINFLKNHKKKPYFWHLIFFALALFTKETAAILPFVCAAYILIFINPKKILSNLRPYFYLLAGWGSILAVWFLIRREIFHNFITNANIHVFSSITNNLISLVPAIGKIILPVRLSVFPILKDMTMIYGIIAITLLLFWLIFSQNKNYRWMLFGAAWFFLFILPTLIKPADKTPEFSENRIYIPMFGFIFLLLGLGRLKILDKVENKISPEFQKKIIATLGIAAIIIFSSITIYRNRYYKDKISFWQNAVETSPSFAFNHNNLGVMYYMDGSLNESEKELKKALEINPQEPMAHSNLGIIYKKRGEFQKADEEYDEEISLNPSFIGSYANKALLYAKMGRIGDSIVAWKKTLEIDPEYPKALYNLFDYYYQRQDKENTIYWAKETQKRNVPLLPEMEKMLNPFAS